MSHDVLHLHWLGPYSLKQLATDAGLLPFAGVYIHKEANPQHSVILYVGKAAGHPTVGQRQVQHHTSGLGAMYLIPARYRDPNQNDWTLDLKRPDVLPTLFDPTLFSHLAAQYIRFSEQIQVFAAQCDPAHVVLAEKELIFFLQPETNLKHKKRLPQNPVALSNSGTVDLINENVPQQLRLLPEYQV